MNKRTVGEILSVIGYPATLSTMACFGAMGTAEGKPSTLLWSIPLAIITLPLLPFSFIGSNILAKCDQEDFKKQTADLPHVYLPEDFVWIEEFEGKWYVQPLPMEHDDQSVVDTEEEARALLSELGYHEVVALGHNMSLGTYWIKEN